MKIAVFLMVAFVIISNVQGDCPGYKEKRFCPSETTGVETKKETSQTDKTKIIVTVTCKNERDIVIKQCTTTEESPNSDVTIQSYQYSQHVRHVHKHVSHINNNYSNDDGKSDSDIERLSF